jgi:hypothetical protein
MVEDKAQARRRPFGAGGWRARHDVPAKADFRSGAEPAGSLDFMDEANGPEATRWEAEASSGFFYSKRP